MQANTALTLTLLIIVANTWPPWNIPLITEYGLSLNRDLNAAINVRNMGLIKVGKSIPEFTPVESAAAAELSRGGLRVATP